MRRFLILFVCVLALTSITAAADTEIPKRPEELVFGTVEWEITMIEYVAALQHRLYQQKMGRPTSPGESNFFNLRFFSR